MSKTKFAAKILFILLIGVSGVQTMVSCATGVGEEGSGSGGNHGQGNGSGSGNSSGSGSGGNSSGSGIGGNSSGSTGGNQLPADCSDAPEPDPQEDPILGDLLEDKRNGKFDYYNTVVIGTQTWMAENLKFDPGTSAPGMHRCYMEGSTDKFLTKEAAQANCNKYGRLYDWATAQTVCPDGWHLPTRKEWNDLSYFVWYALYQNYEDCAYGWDVGSKLKSVDGWKSGIGVDSYGFKAIGSGYCYLCDDGNLNINVGKYDSEGVEAHWWSSTPYVNQWNPSDEAQAYKFNMTAAKNVMTENYDSKKDHLYSVRCIKD